MSTIEVRRVDNAGRGQQEQNGGNFVVEIDTETEEYCLVFKSTDAIMQLEVNDADYDVKMPEDFPFEHLRCYQLFPQNSLHTLQH